MSMEQMIGLGLALAVMFVGLAGTIIPGIPGAPLILVGAIGHKLYFDVTGPSILVLGILVVLTVLSMLLDFLASMLGAKKMGATWKGIVGAVVGAIVGMFWLLPGLIIGPFLGAVIFEMMGGREINQATRAGMGAVIGLIVGTLGRMGCCVAMMGLFTYNVISRSVQAVPA